MDSAYATSSGPQPRDARGPDKAAALRLRRRRWKMNVPLLILFTPIIVFFIVFKYTPMAGLIIAFKQYTFMEGIWGSDWVGLKNFKVLFSNSLTLSIIRNTVVLSGLSIFVGFPFPIALAIMLNEARRKWFKRMVQTLVFLPHFLSWAVIGGIVVTIFSQETGIVNSLLKTLNGTTFPFLYHERSWIAIFVGSGIWKGAGWGSIIYLAALSTIDSHLYEAASMDGAGKWRQIWHITLPGISPTIVLVFILTMGSVMEVGFDQVYILQNASVSGVAEVISTYIYRVGLQRAQFSLTSAMGLFESLIGLVFVLTANRIARRFGQGLW
ncbi:sugar ABC transporter permease [Paenibacillus sp. YN15]|nr:sugar ABC transporter permease [Paenibacillus sp. YN15]